MAESWQRLREGKDVQEHDRILIMREAKEKELMDQGMPYQEAHDLTCYKFGYEYASALVKWLNSR
jgi:hypothetical protein